MAQLLVSVRNAAEAEAALAGGAALIDVKEPRNGPLGRASDETIATVVQAVAGRRPVSAALGELSDPSVCRYPPFGDYAFLKWGLHQAGRLQWRERVERFDNHLLSFMPNCRQVLAAYADWELANAPPLDEVCAYVLRRRSGGVLLLDTFTKAAPPGAARPTLLDFVSPSTIVRLCERCRDAGVRVALAGSLGRAEIEELMPAEPNWFAVRGAVCAGSDRAATVSASKVRELAELLGNAVSPAMSES
jgi:uncharacterized protein (UPF0264 family)